MNIIGGFREEARVTADFPVMTTTKPPTAETFLGHNVDSGEGIETVGLALEASTIEPVHIQEDNKMFLSRLGITVSIDYDGIDSRRNIDRITGAASLFSCF
uniref:Beta-lactamase domain-containing protein n=1 Tax=Syphacia muris TaxID=451379 RepID=A0A0N5B1H0_9BILA